MSLVDGLHVTQVLVVPKIGAMVRRAARSLLENKLVPLAIFLGFLELGGRTGALIAALSWTIAVIAIRMVKGHRIPGLLIMSAVGLIARTIAALATGSMVVYFLQPTATTALVGAAFLLSLRTASPLAERLAHDFCPFDPETSAHPEMQRFFTRLSLLWAASSAINTAITCWLLLTQSVTTFVVVKSFLGPVCTGVTIAAAIVWFRRSLRQKGVQLQFA
ncbi:MAG: VC0807 family protein [Acidimicrobiia bacterium]